MLKVIFKQRAKLGDRSRKNICAGPFLDLAYSIVWITFHIIQEFLWAESSTTRTMSSKLRFLSR